MQTNVNCTSGCRSVDASSAGKFLVEGPNVGKYCNDHKWVKILY